MNKELDDIDQMTRILSGEASSEEREIYLYLLADNPDKKLIFESFEKEWLTTSDALLYKSIDVDAAWNRQKTAILEKPNKVTPSSKVQYWKWAAVLAVGIGLAFYLITDQLVMKNEQMTTVRTGAAEVKEILLSDGSTVTLNENTQLTYNITDQKREVSLVGEAFFKIARDVDHPFIVNLDQAYVKVLGTTFDVKSTFLATSVFVTEGLVEFGLSDNSGKKELLSAGKLGQMSDSQLMQIDNNESNIISWYSKELVFEKSPLEVVFDDLSKTYHVNFEFNKEIISDCHLTASFSKDQLNDILATLSTIYHINFEATQNTYLVTGRGCN